MSSKKIISEAKIAISGKSGCGNSTVSKLLADTLGLRFINFTFRSIAEEKGIDLKKVIELAAGDDSWDQEVDRRQVAMAREGGGCVLGSRLAIWMLQEADLKVFLTASSMARAGRIHEREGGDLQKIAEFTDYRDKQDRERYIRIYGIDNDDYSIADIVIDTGDKNPEQIKDIIIAELERKLA